MNANLSSLNQSSPVCVQTVANMLAYNTTGLTEGQFFMVDSYNAYSNGNTDGGGGLFMMTAQTPTAGTAGSTTGSVDNFVIFQSTFDTTKYFIRQFQGPYFIEWTGAKGDLSADAGAAINSAIVTCPNGSTLTTFTPSQYLITTPILIKNKQAFIFQSGLKAGERSSGGGVLSYNGTSGGTVISHLSCEACEINNWIIDLNSAAIGILTDTASSGATVTSSQNTYRNVQYINNLNTAGATGHYWSKTSGTNNELMSWQDCFYFNFATLSTVTDVGWAQGNNGGFNDHYDVFRNCTAFGAQQGFAFQTGGIRYEGFVNASFCQIAFFQTSGINYPILINFSDHENCWQITKGFGQWTEIHGSRIAACGKSGLALFDCTSGTSVVEISRSVIDTSAVRSAGGYLIDYTGAASAFHILFKQNTYTSAVQATDIHGVTLTATNEIGIAITSFLDPIFGNGLPNQLVTFPPQTGNNTSFFNMLGGLGMMEAPTAQSSAGVVVIQPSGPSVTILQGDGTAINTVNIFDASSLPAVPNFGFFCYAQSNLTFSNTGSGANMAFSGTISSGSCFWMVFKPSLSKWVIAT